MIFHFPFNIKRANEDNITISTLKIGILGPIIRLY